MRDPHGHLIFEPTDGGPPVELDTFQCPHCGGHRIHGTIGPGDRRRLRSIGIGTTGVDKLECRSPGWCFLCGKKTCGSEGCKDHVAAVLRGTMHSRMDSSRVCTH